MALLDTSILIPSLGLQPLPVQLEVSSSNKLLEVKSSHYLSCSHQQP